MKRASKELRIVCFVMAASILAYAGLAWHLPSQTTLKPILLRALSILAASLVAIIFVLRRFLVLPAETFLAAQPEDARMLRRWRQGQMMTYALCEAIALYGLVLHFMGGSTTQVAPFFISGFVLMLLFAPKGARQREFPSDSGSNS